jgi:hypothetical protein
MKEIMAIALPKFTFLSLLIEKPILLVPVVPVIAVTKIVVDFEGVAWLLFWLFLADLGTGLLASYFEWKKSDHAERWFFGKGEGFSSDKAKKMGLKLLVYLGVPFLCIKLQQVLFLKNFKYERISDAEFELASLAVIFFCLIEGFSIFNENLPKCGINLWKIIKEIIGLFKDIKKEISE